MRFLGKNNMTNVINEKMGNMKNNGKLQTKSLGKKREFRLCMNEIVNIKI